MRGTALKIIQQAAVELGLPIPQAAMGATDTNSIQLMALLNAVGADMALVYDWNQLDRIGSITTVANQYIYPLPADYQKFIDGTMWNSQQLGFGMPVVTPQQWQLIKNSSLGSQINSQFRVMNNAMWITPTPTDSNMVLSFEYQSSSWVESANTPGTFTPFIVADLDIPVFDFWLMVKMLKVKMWVAKGLDITNLAAEASGVLTALMGGNNASQVLSLSRRLMLSNPNIPEGNWNA
jgi:hypothetical protein